jgi:flavin-dependent dehydrogenase
MPDTGTGPAPDWDVIVVGAGPGGAAAAKRCAETGLRTLVLEKRSWPRDKVCSGMIMGPWAHDIIRDHFGAIPREVLASPPVLKGHFFHAPGAAPTVLEWPTPLAWRRDLDAWLLQQACEAGAEVRTQARVTRVESDGQIIRLTLNGPDGDEPLSARWVIGADGANSAVRKSLFPGLKTSYSTPIRECYPGSLRLDQNYFHWFFPRGRPRPRFNVNHKDDFFLIEGSGIRELRADISRILADHGFDPSQKPIWRDGCLIPKLHQNLIDGSFLPARGNVLLVGDAAGLIFPITFEGIGSALKSGFLAAEAVGQSARDGRETADVYRDLLRPVLKTIKALLSVEQNLTEKTSATSCDPRFVALSLRDAYQKTTL